MNEAGVDLARLSIAHTLDGFTQFDTLRRKFGLATSDCLVGLETAHNIFIDYLWSQGYVHLYVLPPSLVKANQSRFRQSGAKDDPADARLIAEILRTDRGRLQPWKPDALLTRQMQADLSLILHLNRQAIRLSNRLRSVLLRYYPAVLKVFKSGLTTQIAPEFVRAYPSPQAAKELSLDKFIAFGRKHHYPKPGLLPHCFARLQADYPQASPDSVLIYQEQAVQLADLLLHTTHQKRKTQARLLARYRQHPNYAIFHSLPGTGKFIGPALLAKFGDDPQRFPKAASVQALAGTSPVTEQSGKYKIVRFRRACDKEWRYISQEWAMALVTKTQHPLAVAYFQKIRPHCHSDSHAFRCVANRWIAVSWKVWFSQTVYDEAYHFQQQAARSKPR